MGDAKCTFGTRMPVDIHMLNEVIYREVKHFRNYKIYRPNFGSTPVTGKFYAAHECTTDEGDEESKLKIDHYHHNVSHTRVKGPKSKYSKPITESMEYGWYSKPLLHIDRNDKRLYQPQVESVYSKIETIIAMNNPKNRKTGAK